MASLVATERHASYQLSYACPSCCCRADYRNGSQSACADYQRGSNSADSKPCK
ncbi:hypothetical protein ALQ46_102304 [Pseudomonas savastanoi pv. phaseolicola]|nr:hypothetical protein ALQ46_102304 [Pseudomonas savastanoi pv. phaseolicola]